MTIAVVAEKPSVGRDLAAVLGATRRGEGLLSGNGYVVTWAIGHLVGLAEPEGIRPQWKRWRREELPMLPERWPLTVFDATRTQFEVVRKVLNDPAVESVICATDAGREGELIFRLIYEAAGCRRPVRRLWISSLTEAAIRDGFQKLRPASDFDRLADAALGRSRADWLVGMNLSRAYGLALDGALSVGRVQTPTLAMLVERELQIRDFVPEDYLEVVATFSPREGAAYPGTWFRNEKVPHPSRLPPQGDEAKAVVERALTGEARIGSVLSQTKKLPPPLLYDLTELQRHANRLYGFSAQQTLDLAQTLYERHKLLSYPRTDSRHLSTDAATAIGPVVAAIRAPFESKLSEGTGARPLSRRFVDDTRVTDHHAIIPTAVPATGLSLSDGEQKIYGLVCRRLLQAWQADFVWASTVVVTQVHERVPGGKVDHFRSHGTAIEQLGWKALDVGEARPPRDGDGDEAMLPSGLVRDQPQQVLDAKALPRRTRPPPRLTDATLLTAMETAGKTLDEKELSDAMKDSGLGTPATRASIIETLLTRGYVAREGKSLQATDRGVGLIAVVDAEVKSAAMTGEWEARLGRISRGEGALSEFIRGVEKYVEAVVGRVPPRLPPLPGGTAPPGGGRRGPTPHRDQLALSFAPAAPPAGRSGAVWSGSLANSAKNPDQTAVPRERNGEAAQSAVSRSAGAARRSAEGTAPGLDAGRRAPPVRGIGAAPVTLATDGADAAQRASATHRTGAAQRTPSAYSADAAQRAPATHRTDAPRTPATYATHGRPAAPGGDRPEVRNPLRPDDHPPVRAPAAPLTGELSALLHQRFGFSSFRPHQQAVCVAAAAGSDVLLVMPTGAGKSLCYQLPGLARGGTTLVVSPLIALMEDQVARLQSLGLRAERIHSGRSRVQSRAVCAAYLDGTLDYLFIAPERLGVEGFPQLLAQRKLALLAIDEAHCISQWGHDFRPDYRLLRERLPLLRPAPIVALTATATPIVQEDIVDQLRLAGTAKRFIHGFRRDNLALEALEVPPRERAARTRHWLAGPGRLPAIVYAPTRKSAEAVAEELSADHRVQPYHAGLSTKVRDEVQSAFLGGELDVVVATVAFGMGIDKADIRTVVHLALPGSIESYYQEIGRAGRDGRPSRAVLMHHFADRKTHEFFLERDYPDEKVLHKLSRALDDVPQGSEALRKRTRVKIDTFEKALEKLWIHGGVKGVAEEQLVAGHDGWAEPYAAQRARRVEQLALVAGFAEGHRCRMVALVRHFGDREDSGAPCGKCDVCAPRDCIGASFEVPTAMERGLLEQLLQRVVAQPGLASGRLCRELLGENPGVRNRFERLLGGLVRAGQVRVEDDAFEKEGRQIAFHRLFAAPGASVREVLLPSEVVVAKGRSKSAGRPARRRREKGSRTPAVALPSTGASAALVASLRSWRLEEARRRRVPAFRILTNRALVALAQARPRTAQALRDVSGIGPKCAQTYEAQLLRLCS